MSLKYLKLLWHELLEPPEDYTVFKTEHMTELSGSVERGPGSCNNLIFPVNNMKTSEDSIRFTWLSSRSPANYNLIISEESGRKLVQTVMDTQYLFKTINLFSKKPGRYTWLVKSIDTMEVSTGNGNCETDMPAGFEIITREQQELLLDSLQGENNRKDVIAKLREIDDLENAALVYSAVNLYATLVKDHPHDVALLKGYILFLLKYGFNNEAESAWNEGMK